MSGQKKQRAKLWRSEDMAEAMDCVKNGESVNSASNRLRIPRRTLRNHLASGSRIKKMGKSTTLSANEETELKERIFRLAEVGVPLVDKLLRHCVYRYADINGIPNPFNKTTEMAGRKWMRSFLKRHPDLARRKAQTLNPAPAQKVNRFTVKDYFAKLEAVLRELDIMNKPERIYNMDEKGCRLTVHSQQTVLAKRGAKRVHLIAPEHAENVTIVGCGNAIGNAVPPMILFKGKRLKPEWLDNLPPGSVVHMTPKGSMTTETFVIWVQHLAKYKPVGKILLLFDGATCHLDYTIVEIAEMYDIVLFCLASNTTHELQPFDKAVYRSYEYNWDQEVLRFWDAHPDRQLTKARFGVIFTNVWIKAASAANITSGFQATGIYPFNADILPEEAYAPSDITQQANDGTPNPPQAGDGTPCPPQADDGTPRPPQADVGTPQADDGPPQAGDGTPCPPQADDGPPQAGDGTPRPPQAGDGTPRPPQAGDGTPCPPQADNGLPQAGDGTPCPPQADDGPPQAGDGTPCPQADGGAQHTPQEDRGALQPAQEDGGSVEQRPSTSFSQLLSTPQLEKKKTRNNRRKAINSRAQVVVRSLFTDSSGNIRQSANGKSSTGKGKSSTGNGKSTTGKDKSMSAKPKPKGKLTSKASVPQNGGVNDQPSTSSRVQALESWYCFLCREERQANMRRCKECGKWVHDECIGFTKDDQDEFICPVCQEA